MKLVVKRVLIAAVLVVISVAILAATKAYGVWVIIGIAGALFVLGILRKEKPPGEAGEVRDERGSNHSPRG